MNPPRTIGPSSLPRLACKNVVKRSLYICGIQGGRLDKGERVLLGKRPGLVCRYRAQVSQVGLVPHEHDHDIRVGVLAQLVKPTLDIFVRLNEGRQGNESMTAKVIASKLFSCSSPNASQCRTPGGHPPHRDSI